MSEYGAFSINPERRKPGQTAPRSVQQPRRAHGLNIFFLLVSQTARKPDEIVEAEKKSIKLLRRLHSPHVFPTPYFSRVRDTIIIIIILLI